VDEAWVHRFAKYERLGAEKMGTLPDTPYTAVKFYFNDCFPDTPENRAFRASHTAGAERARSRRVAGNESPAR
jgi:hypothetical protein